MRRVTAAVLLRARVSTVGPFLFPPPTRDHLPTDDAPGMLRSESRSATPRSANCRPATVHFVTIVSVQFLIRLVINAIALWVTTLVVSGIEVSSDSTMGNIGTLLLVALIFGVVNAVIKPVVQVLGCAFYVLTLGLFALVVNAALFLLTGWLAEQFTIPFSIGGFWPAFWGAIVMAVVSWLLSLALPDAARE